MAAPDYAFLDPEQTALDKVARGRSDVRDAAGLGSRHFAIKSSGRPAMLWLLSAHRCRCPFSALHLILEDSLLPVQSSDATNGPDTGMGDDQIAVAAHMRT
jgi:hypothetical protein